ncbi:hypothetical protein BH23THE1_BH23THE1_32500 [soil metagenome]
MFGYQLYIGVPHKHDSALQKYLKYSGIDFKYFLFDKMSARPNPLRNLYSDSGSRILPFRPTPLPWEKNALVPFLSPHTITLLFDYYLSNLEKLNTLALSYPELQSMSLGQIVLTYPVRTLFNNLAAEVLNHELFFRCLSPNGGSPSVRLYQTIVQQFKSFENFVSQFNERAIQHFGSGWVWLVFDPTTTFLMIVDGDNAYNPVLDG